MIRAHLGPGDMTTAAATTSTAAITAPIPANTVRGDVLLAAVSSDIVGQLYTDTPGWVRLGPDRLPGGVVRDLAVFHAFTSEGVPGPPVITQISASRLSLAVFRVTGAHQTERYTGSTSWSGSDSSANTDTFVLPGTGAEGLTIAAAYANTNAAQGPVTHATFDGLPADIQVVSHGAGSPGGSSATTLALKALNRPGPFTLAWGKTVANSQGFALTIPAEPETTWEAMYVLGGQLVQVTLEGVQSATGTRRPIAALRR